MKTVEEAYKEYKEWVRKDKERLCIDFERTLKALGMWEVDVIRKSDGAKGRLKVWIPKTVGKDPSIQFYKYIEHGRISKLYTGNIPKKNTEAYIKNLFILDDPPGGKLDGR